MDAEHLKLFDPKLNYYLLMSDRTNDVFIGKKATCYFFETKSDAEGFIKHLKKGKLGEYKDYHNIQSFLDKLYQKGVERIKIKLCKRNDFIGYVIKPEDLKKDRYENHLANLYLANFQESRLKGDFEQLANCKFITPIALLPRKEKEYQTIKYCVLKRTCVKYNVLFTTLQEFNSWAKSRVTEYYPMEVDLLKAKRIRGDNGVIINPMSTRMLLEDSDLKKLEEKKETK